MEPGAALEFSDRQSNELLIRTDRLVVNLDQRVVSVDDMRGVRPGRSSDRMTYQAQGNQHRRATWPLTRNIRMVR
jgi:hypothetical protein